MDSVFDTLKDFIDNKMSMQHIYQPVMLRTLLRNGGEDTTGNIASNILSFDTSQIEYYKDRVDRMVGTVLKNRELIFKEYRKPIYKLIGYSELTEEQIKSLIKLCDTKIQSYINDYGDEIWEHRNRNRKVVSGSDRYEVLKRAKHRCELCGISADEKGLEVDHIVPNSKGGKHDISNFQALCYSCNSNKLNRDDTDFRGIRAIYDFRDSECTFCNLPQDRKTILENELAYVIQDGFPVTEGHSLVIPKRHVATYFQLGQAELNAIHDLLLQRKEQLQSADESISGFNIGINNGEDAGQTIFHCHVHLIPRRSGDVEEPRGGVRHLIPGKGSY